MENEWILHFEKDEPQKQAYIEHTTCNRAWMWGSKLCTVCLTPIPKHFILQRDLLNGKE